MKSSLFTRLFLYIAVGFLPLLSGCGSWQYSNGTSVSMGVVADRVSDLESKTVHRIFAATEGDTLRFRNLAGTIKLMPGEGDMVSIEAVVYAKGRDAVHTQTLLDGMEWTESTDRKGRAEWALGYPVARHQTFHYSQDGPGFRVKTDRWDGRQITITTKKNSGTPTLFADLIIVLPAEAKVSVRSLAGRVEGTELAGELSIDTIVGGIGIESFSGTLALDTGSGDIATGMVDGRYNFDTGSGDIRAASLAGKGVLDTGSGDITVDEATGDSLNADTGSGDISIGNASVQTLRADTGSGSITLAGGRVDRMVADTGSGNIHIRGVEFIDFRGDTGSGNITIESSLSGAETLIADTGSGNITIYAGPDASFQITADQGSGRLRVKYKDAKLRFHGRELVGATRGDGKTRIVADTGSGNCVIGPG